jgi:hypothetical protein
MTPSAVSDTHTAIWYLNAKLMLPGCQPEFILNPTV